MGWRSLVIDDLPRKRLRTISAHLARRGCAGVQEEGAGGAAQPVQQPWDTGPKPRPPASLRLQAWFEDADEAALLADVAELAPTARAWFEDIVEVDWESKWKAGFEPIVVSDRLTVAPPWDAPEGAVIIEPGQGFGTGQHTTTRQVLTAIDALVAPDWSTALDVGSGSGILALAAAHLGLHTRGIDVDPVAVDDAMANAARNGRVIAFDTTPVGEVEGTWDLVLANLFAETLVELASPLVARTGRALVLAGILADREAGVRAAFDGLLGPPARQQEGEWVCLVYRRDAA